SKKTGVSYTLKHFPGYGNNVDTHVGSSIDNRTYDSIVIHDLPPFKAGIKVGAEAILISHNTVTSIDPNYPASLSANVHNLLRNELDFTGIVIADDLDMGALSSIDHASVLAILAGNDMIITTNYAESFSEIKNAISSNQISEAYINQLAFRVLAWKYYKGLMFVDQK
ncbi:MAG: glycoside hydrolase family 3 N-terminal domain-containing protein, partial [bacterium]|nr:glycoside hydrolase family 3 N-terminal domain-containing protein [bacterium]